MADEEECEPGGEALYWLCNLTDAPLEFWLQTPGQLQNGTKLDLSKLGMSITSHSTCSQHVCLILAFPLTEGCSGWMYRFVTDSACPSACPSARPFVCLSVYDLLIAFDCSLDQQPLCLCWCFFLQVPWQGLPSLGRKSSCKWACSLLVAKPVLVHVCAGKPCVVPNRATHPLLPSSSSETAWQGCHVGDPKLFASFPASTPSPASSSSSLQLSDAADEDQPTKGDLTMAQTSILHAPWMKDSLLCQGPVSDTDSSVPSASSPTGLPSSSEAHCTATQQGASGLEGQGALLQGHANAVMSRYAQPETQQSISDQGEGHQAWLQPVMCHRQAGMKVLVKVQGQNSSAQPLGSWDLGRDQQTSTQVSVCSQTRQQTSNN